MGKRKVVKLGEAPPYPSDAQAKAYALIYANEVFSPPTCRQTYQRTPHNQTVDVLCTWGCNDNFFVFSFPPAGFTFKHPQDVLDLHTFEGWILERIPDTETFNLLVKASRDGVDFFWKEHARRTR